MNVSLVIEEYPFHEGDGPHISGSGKLLTQDFILSQGVSIAFLLGFFRFLLVVVDLTDHFQHW